PHYDGSPPWGGWNPGVESLPWAALDGEGEALVELEGSLREGQIYTRSEDLSVRLVVRTERARDLTGRLFLPKASGGGFLSLAFRVPAARAVAGEKDFQRAERQRLQRFLQLRLPGGAWFRHRHDELEAALGPEDPPLSDVRFPQDRFRKPAEALELFSGG